MHDEHVKHSHHANCDIDINNDPVERRSHASKSIMSEHAFSDVERILTGRIRARAVTDELG